MDFYERWADGVPALLRLLQQLMAYEGPTPYDPEALAQINVPVLLLRGQETLLGAQFGEAARHIARYVADPQVHELQGVGHFAPVLAPEQIAEELVSFFEKVLQPT
jgi:pimeloyl-ACP methyl ester carboxylesterase